MVSTANKLSREIIIMTTSNSALSSNTDILRNNPGKLSVVIPCYNEEEVLPQLIERLSKVMTNMGNPYELILVDDGSRDRTWTMLCEYQMNNSHLKVIKLSRNIFIVKFLSLIVSDNCFKILFVFSFF